MISTIQVVCSFHIQPVKSSYSLIALQKIDSTVAIVCDDIKHIIATHKILMKVKLPVA